MSTIAGIQLDMLPEYVTDPSVLVASGGIRKSNSSAAGTLQREDDSGSSSPFPGGGTFSTIGRRGSLFNARGNAPPASTGPTAFERLVPNFVSKQVREYVDAQVRRVADANLNDSGPPPPLVSPVIATVTAPSTSSLAVGATLSKSGGGGGTTTVVMSSGDAGRRPSFDLQPLPSPLLPPPLLPAILPPTIESPSNAGVAQSVFGAASSSMHRMRSRSTSGPASFGKLNLPSAATMVTMMPSTANLPEITESEGAVGEPNPDYNSQTVGQSIPSQGSSFAGSSLMGLSISVPTQPLQSEAHSAPPIHAPWGEAMRASEAEFAVPVIQAATLSKMASKKERKVDPRVVIRNLQPVAIEGWAAVVMCDVSGYSKLAAFLADRGPEGAEIMSKIMKGFLDKIIQIIMLHGGDIVKFVGDAVIFYWKYTPPAESWLIFAEKRLKSIYPDATGERLGELLERAKLQRQGTPVVKAAECCLDLLHKLQNYTVQIPPPANNPSEAPATRELKIHLGIGAGKIYDVHVGGDPGRWEHFVVGDAMEQLAQVLDLASPGQVALSKKAFEWFKHCVNVARVDLSSFNTKKCYILNSLDKSAIQLMLPDSEEGDGDDFMALWDIQTGDPASTGNIELYRLYINQSALYKLESDIQSASPFQLNQGVSHLMALSELRQVTTVFIKIGALSFAPVEAAEAAIKEQDAWIAEQAAPMAEVEKDLDELERRIATAPSSSDPAAVTIWEERAQSLRVRLADLRAAMTSSKDVLRQLTAEHKSKLREALARCQAVMTAVQVALKKFEGILRQFHVDDKGAVILAFFGLPPLAHKNDAMLGVQAGMLICEDLKRHFDEFSIGVTTGVISIGGVGNSLRTEYALMGDSINMAARIMSLSEAHASLIVDERTFALCSQSHEFEELGQRKVKGKENPIFIFRPLRSRGTEKRADTGDSAGMAELNLVGRRPEQDAVREAMDRHSKGGANNVFLLVEGEGGQGLTSFGGFVRDLAEQCEYDLCIATSVESERSSPYFALRGIIRDLINALDNSHIGDESAIAKTGPQSNLVRPRSLLASAILNTSNKLGTSSVNSSAESVSTRPSQLAQLQGNLAPNELSARNSGNSRPGGASNPIPPQERPQP
ncbi:hypothetical protein BC828DRAFT_268396 [Blastocladiella britannica]|nr:hypothetical protein BC828DRAFT_268396 [Blastocladiella britannica]